MVDCRRPELARRAHRVLRRRQDLAHGLQLRRRAQQGGGGARLRHRARTDPGEGKVTVMRNLWLTAKLDIVESLRARWFLVYSLVFGAIVVLSVRLRPDRIARARLHRIVAPAGDLHPADDGDPADLRPHHDGTLGGRRPRGRRFRVPAVAAGVPFRLVLGQDRRPLSGDLPAGVRGHAGGGAVGAGEGDRSAVEHVRLLHGAAGGDGLVLPRRRHALVHRWRAARMWPRARPSWCG
ncbi:MAG: hypothetical protein MZW92_42940 [Comamonadaceae bacterium]|nr:hypothetical protein [Comamonadaceae bacterium]